MNFQKLGCRRPVLLHPSGDQRVRILVVAVHPVGHEGVERVGGVRASPVD